MLLALAVAAGCDDGGEKRLQAYFEKLNEAGQEFNDRIEAHRFEPDVEPEEDPFDVVREWLEGSLVISGDYVRALEMIEPPTELSQPHMELVDAARDLNAAAVSTVSRFDEVESADEAKEFLEHALDSRDPAVSEASRRFSAACAALQEAAAANGVEVTLVCGD